MGNLCDALKPFFGNRIPMILTYGCIEALLQADWCSRFSDTAQYWPEIIVGNVCSNEGLKRIVFATTKIFIHREYL